VKDTQRSRHQDNTDSLREENLQLPTNLDEQSIANHLRMISRANPQQLPATVQAIREKWAYMVGGWAERGRLEYLNTVLLQLKISHDILAQSLAMDDEWQLHVGKKVSRKAEADAGIAALEAQAKAEELHARVEKAKTEQAEARKKQCDLERPAKGEPELTGEQRRKQKLKELDDQINRLLARKDQVLSDYLKGRRLEELSVVEQEEYRADENMYSDRIRQAKERRMQFE